MAEISRIGCAIEDQESEIGCPWAGNPILDLTSGVIAAIAVAVQARKSDWPFETPQPERQFSTTPAMFNTAISVAGTTAQIRSEEFTYFGQLVRQTAADISEGAGFHAGQDRILRAVTWAGKRSRIPAVQPIRQIVEPALEFD